jgi:hypothetical protein
MTLAERLTEYVRACFPALWVRTHERDDALAEIARACHDGGWTLATWDLERGLELPVSSASPGGASDPLAAIPQPIEFHNTIPTPRHASEDPCLSPSSTIPLRSRSRRPSGGCSARGMTRRTVEKICDSTVLRQSTD